MHKQLNLPFPEILKAADVTPIYKKNDPEEPGNYKPISIAPEFQNLF